MNAKLPIISFLQKLIFFCYLIFEQFEKKFLNQGFSHFLPRQHDQKAYSFFQNCTPQDIKFFQMVPKRKGVFIRMDSLLTMVTNSFENPIIQKNLETFYSSSFLH